MKWAIRYLDIEDTRIEVKSSESHWHAKGGHWSVDHYTHERLAVQLKNGEVLHWELGQSTSHQDSDGLSHFVVVYIIFGLISIPAKLTSVLTSYAYLGSVDKLQESIDENTVRWQTSLLEETRPSQ